jgi:hypothetical protein
MRSVNTIKKEVLDFLLSIKDDVEETAIFSSDLDYDDYLTFSQLLNDCYNILNEFEGEK